MLPDSPRSIERDAYYRGIELFNAHDYFEAHEVWEEAWHLAGGRRHLFYQGLIQCAVALEHYRRGNPRGVASLFRTYPRKFAGLPDVYMGLHVPGFLDQMRIALSPVVDAPALPEKGTIELDLGNTPRIELRYDPFEDERDR